MAEGGWDEAAFAQGVDDAYGQPEKISARLFSLRAEGLLAGLTPPPRAPGCRAC